MKTDEEILNELLSNCDPPEPESEQWTVDCKHCGTTLHCIPYGERDEHGEATVIIDDIDTDDLPKVNSLPPEAIDAPHALDCPMSAMLLAAGKIPLLRDFTAFLYESQVGTDSIVVIERKRMAADRAAFPVADFPLSQCEVKEVRLASGLVVVADGYDYAPRLSVPEEEENSD